MDSKGSSGRTTPERSLRPGEMAVSAESLALPVRSPLVHDDLVGTILDGRYRIQSLIGVGGMSAVYKAHDPALDKIVAVKMLHQHLSTKRNSLERFLQEGRTESSVRHANIVSVLAAGADSGRLFLVMDYLEGKSLDEIVSLGGAIPQQAARNIFVQICDALGYAHARGIVHRDLKPSNIMLVGPNLSIVKIVDFGVAKLLGSELLVSQSETAGGAIVGSPPYMSPEQCTGQLPDGRSDIYSLGCLMYETLTGKLPLDADTSFAMICRQLHDSPASFAAVAPEREISNELEQIVFRAMEKLPENRYQTADELMKALKTVELPATSSDANTVALQSAVSTGGSHSATGVISGNRAAAIFKKSIGAAVAISVTVVAVTAFLNCSALMLAISQPHLEQELVDAQQSFGTNSPQYAAAALPIADAYWQAGVEGKAKPYYRIVADADLKWPVFYGFQAPKEIQIAERAARNAGERQQLLIALGHAHKNLGDIPVATKLLETSVDSPGALPHVQQQILVELAEMASLSQNYRDEQRYVEQAMSMMQNNKGLASNLALSALLLKRAECDRRLTSPEAAVESYRSALRMMPHNSRLDIVRRADILRNIGSCLQEVHKGDEAIRSYLAELEELKKANPPRFQDLAETYRIVGNFYFQGGNYVLAEKYHKLCLQLKDRLPPQEVEQTEELVADGYFAQKRYGEQKAILQRLIQSTQSAGDDPERVQALQVKLAQSEAARIAH